jgi:hypothetical protein
MKILRSNLLCACLIAVASNLFVCAQTTGSIAGWIIMVVGVGLSAFSNMAPMQ